MKLFGRARRLMLGGALAIGTLAGLTVAAPSSQAAPVQSALSARTQTASAATLTSACYPTRCTYLAGPTLNLEAYSGCTYLIAWGWNYTSGGKVDLKFYDDSAATDSTQATAASSGYLNGYVQWDIPNTGYHTYHKYWVSAYDEASGWSVSSNYVQC